MKNSVKPPYLLPSNEEERSRLLAQHELWRRKNGNKIILPPIHFVAGDKVLDSGTGTAVWLLDVTNDLPSSVDLYGIDTVAKMFPESYPSNIHLSICSITSLPAEWTNTFKLVNQRFLIAGLKKSEWPIALKEIYRVLAPGGWVQLCDGPAPVSTGPSTDKIKSLAEALFNKNELDVEVGENFGQLLAQAGFGNICNEKRTFPVGGWAGEDGEIARNNMVSVWKGMKKLVMANGGFGLVTSDEYDLLLDECSREFDEIKGTEQTWCISYAQKLV